MNLSKQRWKAIFMHDGRKAIEANALIIQYSMQYRESTELRCWHTFVFHVKQVDIAIDTSPMPFT